jgi:hypothetical protein
MKIASVHFACILLVVAGFFLPTSVHSQHAFGIAGDYLSNLNNTDNSGIAFRLSYDRSNREALALRGMFGGTAGGQVVARTAVPRDPGAGLPLDTVKVDEREKYFNVTIGLRKYVFGGSFASGGAYLHAALHVGFYGFKATPEAYNDAQYELPGFTRTKDSDTFILVPIGLGYEKRAGKLVPFGEVAFMPGTSTADGAEFVPGLSVTIGLRFPFGE